MSLVNQTNISTQNQDDSLLKSSTTKNSLMVENFDNKDKLLNIIPEKREKSIVFPPNFFSAITFSWAYSTIKLGRRSRIRESSLGNISPLYQARQFFNEINPLWHSKFKYKKNYALLRALLSANSKKIFDLFFFTIIESLLHLASIYLFRQILLSFQEKETKDLMFSLNHSVLLMLIINFLSIFIKRKNNFLTQVIDGKIILQLNSLIYDKLLRVATFNKGSFSEGELINFIQEDSEKFGKFLSTSPRMLIIPFQFSVYFYFLFRYFGPYFIIGLIAFAIDMAVLSWINNKQTYYKKEELSAKDKRMKVLTETFNIIKTIKLYSWEKPFIDRINEKRKTELFYQAKASKLGTFHNTLFWSAEIILSLTSISAYILFGNQMNSANIMTSLYIFSCLDLPMIRIPEFLAAWRESNIGLNRIEKFLQSEDSDSSQIENLPVDSQLAIKIDKCQFGVKIDGEMKILLHDVELEVKKGELIGIIGEIGAGKTTLLNGILNNMQVIGSSKSGNIKISGKIAYASQNSWILNDTIRNNILFFKEMNEEKYLQILEICELTQDMKALPDGDLTEIGDKGANLSGGQKTRIAIARALYSDADIFLFDDPLSTLDAYVSMKIFSQVFAKYLRTKTILLVTHALQYIKHTDRVLYIKEGKIHWSGPSSEIESQKFYKEFSVFFKEKTDRDKDKNPEEDSYSNKKKTSPIENQKPLTRKEEEKKIKITFSKCLDFYFYAGGISFLLWGVLVNLAIKLYEISSDYFVTFWSSNNLRTKAENFRCLLIYGSLSGIGIVLTFLRSKCMYDGLKIYCKNMHDTLLNKLIHAPINLFHDITPKGQILSRFHSDLDTSATLNFITNVVYKIFFMLLGCIVVCCFYNYYSLLMFISVVTIQMFVVKFYLPSARDLNGLERNSRPPIINAFGETIPGVHVIRAYKYERNFTEKFYKRLNSFYKIKVFQGGITDWFGLILDLISFIILVFILGLGLIFKGYITSKSIGLLLSYSFKIIDYLFNGMNRWSLVERLLVSFDRCDSYTKIIEEKESPKEVEENFPEKGEIKFVNYSVRYRPETPLVLKNLNLTINAGEKIGVVGRTGSGKSTLCLCLFRVLESYRGKILIDNADISELNLEFLRKRLTIIPQDPTLIDGSLKENIDPVKETPDQEIIQSLSEVGLKEFVEKGLDYHVEENGVNLSFGEKQIICICRALLRKSRIVVMDEATSNIDYKTETIIQKVLDKVLQNSTVITIAHRIKTIINYDKVLVLSNGEVAEYDSPKNLLKNKRSIFFKLYSESGL